MYLYIIDIIIKLESSIKLFRLRPEGSVNDFMWTD